MLGLVFQVGFGALAVADIDDGAMGKAPSRAQCRHDSYNDVAHIAGAGAVPRFELARFVGGLKV
jgi:hypothetical protein